MGPLSEDLRKRVVSAVCEEGMSCRGSARRFGVSFSSAIRTQRSKQYRPDVLERRRRWFDGQLDLDPLKLVFVDETAATTNMARRFVRRRRGQRLRCGVPHGHYKAITFVFGLRLRGVVAPKAYDHAMNAETFEAWLEHHLLPTLEEGDIVVLDNLKAHKSPTVAEILAKEKTARSNTCRPTARTSTPSRWRSPN